MTSTPIDLGRPVAGDVVELILDDHRRFETLLRQLRDSSTDRDTIRTAFAARHVAHAEAEEKHVYPVLRKRRAIGEHEREHGEEELTILNPAREEVSGRVRAELGAAFAAERTAQLDADCCRLESVRAIVAGAAREGVLPAGEDGEQR